MDHRWKPGASRAPTARIVVVAVTGLLLAAPLPTGGSDGPADRASPRRIEAAPSPRPAMPESTSPASLGTQQPRSLLDAVLRSEYAFSGGGDGGHLSAPNRRQGLRATATAEGLRVEPRARGGTGADWTLAIVLSRYGREGALHAAGPVPPRAEGNRVEFRREHLGLIEWYLNNERGIEQGFTLNRPPEGGLPGRPLVMELALSGDLIARPGAGEDTFHFETRAGTKILNFGGLKAWGAHGHLLPTALRLRHGRLQITVDDAGAPYPIIVDPLLTGADWTAESDQAGASLGFSVAGAGDVNGDGFDDVIAGAPLFDGGQPDEGKVFLWLGGPGGLGANGTPGNADWSFESDQAGAQLGHSVASAGDVNADGFDDVILGAPFYESGAAHADEGRVFVFHGTASGIPVTASPWIAQLDQAGVHLGWSVAGAGDLNGDGVGDIVAGAPEGTNGQPGEGGIFVWFGSDPGGLGPNGTPFNIGWFAESNQAGARLGLSVAPAGDVNGDGPGDLIAGAPLYDTAGGDDRGWAFVWLGVIDILPLSGGGLPGNPATAQWSAESTQPASGFGTSVASAGDLNGGGRPDLIVGAPLFDNPEADEGIAFVWLAEPGLAGHVTAAAAAWLAQSDQAGAQLGGSVAAAGDVDADGFDDLIVGAPFFDGAPGDDRGGAFLWRGSPAGLGPLGDPGNADWTAHGQAAGARLGTAVASAGDVNGDMLADVIAGAPLHSAPEGGEGRAYLFAGFFPPAFLEFGPRGSPRRVEGVATSYSEVRGLATGEYEISGTAEVTMGGCLPAPLCTRPFTFGALTAVKDPSDTASNGAPAFTVTGGTAVVSAPGDPIPFPDPGDLNLKLYSFALDAAGAATEAPFAAGGVPQAGLWLTLPDTLTTATGPLLDLPSSVPLEQDLDFTASITPHPDGIRLKDYPLKIRPRAGTTYRVTRSRGDLGLSDLGHLPKERGDLVDADPGPGTDLRPRCDAIPGACLDEANDDIFRLDAAAGSRWDLNRYEGVKPPAGSVGSPFVERGGLRGTLHLDAAGTYLPLFPAGVTVTLDPGSTIEFVGSDPSGGSLDGSLAMSLRTGAIYEEEVDGCPVLVTDCTGLRNWSATFGGGQLLPGGIVHLPSLTPLPGSELMHWGGPGPVPLDPARGFYVAGLASPVLSFFAPASVARFTPLGPPRTVQEHLLSKMEGGTAGRGTYAGVNVRDDPVADPGDAVPTTTGLDTLCPPAASKVSGHSLSVPSSEVRLHARRSGVTGVADAGGIGSTPFDYMGYDLTLQRFGAAFLDNEVRSSGVAARTLSVPSPSNVGFNFSFDGRVELKHCGEFGGMGDLSDTGERTLEYWAASFVPRSLTFEPAVPPGAGCAPEGEACEAEIPVGCVGPGMDPEDVRYVHVLSNVPLDLDVQDPNRLRFRDRVDFDFTPAPEGHLVCSDLMTAGPAGVVRNEFEPGLGFDVDLIEGHLRPRLDPDSPDPDPNARYEIRGETHLPFYGAMEAASVVFKRAADVRRDFDDPSSKVAVTRRVLADLVDLRFNLEYLPPDLNLNLPARFLSLNGAFDLKFLRVPVSMKLLGKGHPLGDDLGLPELYGGYLADLSAYAEARIGGACDAACRGVLDRIADLDEFAGSVIPPEMFAALDAGHARLASLGGEVRARVASELEDAIGSALPADVARAAGRVTGFIEGVRKGFQAFRTEELTGPGRFLEIADEPEVRDFVLQKIDINAGISILEFLDFQGFLSFARHTANTVDDLVGGAPEDTAHVLAGAADVDLGWVIGGVRAERIAADFHFDADPFRVWGFDGEITLADVAFGEVQLDRVGLALGMANDPPDFPGEDFFWVAGAGRGKYKSATAEAGFFLGKSIDLTPLEFADPDVAEVLTGRTRLTGIYARAGASFPILGGPDCFPFNLSGGGAAGFWLFSEGPTFGAKLRMYATGELLCIVSARADLTLLGGLTGDVWHLSGHGFAAGGIGDCEPEDWDSPRDVLNDGWCLACVLSGEFRTSSRSSRFEGDFRGPECD